MVPPFEIDFDFCSKGLCKLINVFNGTNMNPNVDVSFA